MRASWRVIAVLAMALMSVPFGQTTPALAHERREVGPYTVVVGFTNEPALVDQFNGAYLKVTNTQTKEPVEGLDKTLQVEVTASGRNTQFKLRALRNQPGEYSADFIPTRIGAYTFRFFGTIDTLAVNEKFDSGPGRFNDIESTNALQFPEKAQSAAETSRQLAEAQTSADQARRFAFGAAGVQVVTLLGLMVFLIFRPRSPRTTPVRPPVSAPGDD